GARLIPEALLWRLGTTEDVRNTLVRPEPVEARRTDSTPRLDKLGANETEKCGFNIHELLCLPIERTRNFFATVHLPAPLDEAADLLLTEIRARFGYLVQ